MRTYDPETYERLGMSGEIKSGVPWCSGWHTNPDTGEMSCNINMIGPGGTDLTISLPDMDVSVGVTCATSAFNKVTEYTSDETVEDMLKVGLEKLQYIADCLNGAKTNAAGDPAEPAPYFGAEVRSE